MQVDFKSAEIAHALDADGRIYAKFGEVTAVRATEPTPVETKLQDGTVETTNIAQPGDFIVTNPNGERYVLKEGKFLARYAPTDRDGVYAPTGRSVAVRNFYGEPISGMASWGELQHGATDCWIADTINPATGRRDGSPYIIAAAEFEQTYRLAQRNESRRSLLQRALAWLNI